MINTGLFLAVLLYPLETIPGYKPSFLSSLASQITKGVFPVPPTVRFPITIVLKSGCHGEALARFRTSLNQNL